MVRALADCVSYKKDIDNYRAGNIKDKKLNDRSKKQS